MDVKYTAEELIDFEKHIKQCYINKEIPYPIHLRSGCEENLIKIFQNIKQNDYVLCTWSSHIHALLKGIPKDKVKQRIVDGLSISLCFPEYRFFSSGIAGNLIGAAVGIGMGIKRSNANDQVYCCIGDMVSYSGIFHEAMTYA